MGFNSAFKGLMSSICMLHVSAVLTILCHLKTWLLDFILSFKVKYLNAWGWSVGQKHVDCVWNVMAHAQNPVFFFRPNGRVHLNRRGRQFSRLLAGELCTSACRVCAARASLWSAVMWRLLVTHSILLFPLHFFSRASACAITFQLDSTIYTDEINRICRGRWQHVCQIFVLNFALSACTLNFAEFARTVQKVHHAWPIPSRPYNSNGYTWAYSMHVCRLIPIYFPISLWFFIGCYCSGPEIILSER